MREIEELNIKKSLIARIEDLHSHLYKIGNDEEIRRYEEITVIINSIHSSKSFNELSSFSISDYVFNYTKRMRTFLLNALRVELNNR